LVNTASIAPPGGVTDAIPGNNTDTDTDTLVGTLPETLDLQDMTLGGVVTFEAGRTITVTNCIVDAPGGNVTFRAGESVIFGDGFHVETGCTITVEIDPALLP
jgi:hypothetical protein